MELIYNRRLMFFSDLVIDERYNDPRFIETRDILHDRYGKYVQSIVEEHVTIRRFERTANNTEGMIEQ